MYSTLNIAPYIFHIKITQFELRITHWHQKSFVQHLTLQLQLNTHLKATQHTLNRRNLVHYNLKISQYPFVIPHFKQYISYPRFVFLVFFVFLELRVFLLVLVFWVFLVFWECLECFECFKCFWCFETSRCFECFGVFSVLGVLIR